MEEDHRYKEAKERVGQLRRFYSDLISYVIVNVILLAINLVTSPGALWFYWVTIFWGIAVLLHAVETFSIKDKYLGREWEEKKIQEMMGKEDQDKSQRKAS